MACVWQVPKDLICYDIICDWLSQKTAVSADLECVISRSKLASSLPWHKRIWYLQGLWVGRKEPSDVTGEVKDFGNFALARLWCPLSNSIIQLEESLIHRLTQCRWDLMMANSEGLSVPAGLQPEGRVT